MVLAPLTMGKGHRPKVLTLSSPIQFTSVSPAPGTVPGITVCTQIGVEYIGLLTKAGAEKGVVSVDLSGSILGGGAGLSELGGLGRAERESAQWGSAEAKAGRSVGGKAGGVQAVESHRRLDERGNKEL